MANYGGIEIPVELSQKYYNKTINNINKLEAHLKELAEKKRKIVINLSQTEYKKTLNNVKELQSHLMKLTKGWVIPLRAQGISPTKGDESQRVKRGFFGNILGGSRSKEESFYSSSEKIAKNTEEIVRLLHKINNRSVFRQRQDYRIMTGSSPPTANRETRYYGGGGFLRGGGFGLGSLGTGITAYGALRGGLKSLQTASAYEESMNRLNIALPSKSVDEVRETVKKMASRGFSLKGTAERLASATDLLKGIYSDKTDAETLKLAKKIHRNAVDLASAKNIGFERAMNAILGLMLGEPEKLKFSAGISILDEDVKEHIRRRLFEQAEGRYKSLLDKDLAIATNTLMRDKQVKANVRYHLFQKIQRRQGVEGDYERTKHLWANQFRILQENFTDILTGIGRAMEGTLLPLLRQLNDLIRDSDKYVDIFIKYFKRIFHYLKMAGEKFIWFADILGKIAWILTLGPFLSGFNKLDIALSLLFATIITWFSAKVYLAFAHLTRSIREFHKVVATGGKGSIGILMGILTFLVSFIALAKDAGSELDNQIKYQNFLDSLSNKGKDIDQTVDKITKLMQVIGNLGDAAGKTLNDLNAQIKTHIDNMNKTIQDQVAIFGDTKNQLQSKTLLDAFVESMDDPSRYLHAVKIEVDGDVGGHSDQTVSKKKIKTTYEIDPKKSEQGNIRRPFVGSFYRAFEYSEDKKRMRSNRILFTPTMLSADPKDTLKFSRDQYDYIDRDIGEGYRKVGMRLKDPKGKVEEIFNFLESDLASNKKLHEVLSYKQIDFKRLRKEGRGYMLDFLRTGKYDSKKLSKYGFQNRSMLQSLLSDYLSLIAPNMGTGRNDAYNTLSTSLRNKIGYGKSDFSGLIRYLMKFFLERDFLVDNVRTFKKPKEPLLKRTEEEEEQEEQEKPEEAKTKIRNWVLDINLKFVEDDNYDRRIATYQGIEEIGTTGGASEYIKDKVRVKVFHRFQ